MVILQPLTWPGQTPGGDYRSNTSTEKKHEVKITNETKIGALTAIAVTFLILGFNFLKGKSLFKTGTFLYARYTDTKKLMPSNPVFINGFQVGNVANIEAGDENVSSVIVEIKLNEDYNIPDDSYAVIEANPLGTSAVVITTGKSTTFYAGNDTIQSRESGGMLSEITGKLTPVADQLKATLASLDTVLRNVNNTLDPNTKGNLQSVIENLNKASASIAISAVSLQAMMQQQSGSIAKSMDNVNSFTKNLSDNNEKISSMMSNIEKTTENLAKADIDGAINNLKASIESLNSIMSKINSTDGSVGALINDKEMYNNLNNTMRSLNILMDDLRVHPKRYVHVSVFGKKDKGEYLTAPLNDTTAAAQPVKQ